MVNLSEDDKRYDRQIRLYGKEAQENLRLAEVCLIGVDGVGSEIAKNLVLGGIKALTLVDNRKISEAPAGQVEAQMLIAHEGKQDQEKSIAELSLARCYELNPSVETTSEAEVPYEKISSGKFRIVICCNQSRELERKVSAACRKAENQTCFLAGSTAGLFGMAIIDCGEKYTCQVQQMPKPKEAAEATDLDGESPAKKSKPSEAKDKEAEPEADGPVFSEQSFAYDSFATVADRFSSSTAEAPVFKGLNKRKLKNLSQAAVVLGLVYEQQELNSDNAKDQAKKLTGKDNFWESEFHNLEELAYTVKGQFAPVTAIVGGFMAQEVIRVASKRERPFDNVFFFDGFNMKGETMKV